ncbi:MAG TPA: DUF998 domain-containing protein [Thermoanaerobaculia bacterium]|nr:DUF998 domain-containing protein [Thermoanaerobaculia bacterium]
MRNLDDHIAATYTTLRVGIIVLASALPFILAIGSGTKICPSISAYYYGDLRDVLVGVLVAVGAFLYLYKGFTKLENYALNLAGIFLVGVALVPTDSTCQISDTGPSLHGTFAVLFFLAIAYVCIFRASDTLSLISDAAKADRYRKTYKLLGLGMIVIPLAVVVLTVVLPSRSGSGARPTVFLVETAGVLVFASYWLLKSREIALSNAERLALQGKLAASPQQAADTFKPAAVTAAAPLPG